MLGLTKQERIILIFLLLTFVGGLGINSYKKSKISLQVHKPQPNRLNAVREKCDNFIEQYTQININSFNIDGLTRLPGVGDKLARRIVEYRQRQGQFATKEELMQVKGIGEKKFNSFKHMIILK